MAVVPELVVAADPVGRCFFEGRFGVEQADPVRGREVANVAVDGGRGANGAAVEVVGGDQVPSRRLPAAGGEV